MSDDDIPILDTAFVGVVLFRDGERHLTEPCDTRRQALRLARQDAKGREVRAIWARQIDPMNYDGPISPANEGVATG